MKKGYADTSFGQIHYRRVEGAGVPVILLHRTPVASHSFDRMLALLDGKRTAVALDTPGFGQSFRPQGLPVAADYARWFLAAIDALKINKFHLCAHHTGTHFSAEMARLAPDRVRSLLLSGVLYSGEEERQEFRKAIGDSAPIDKNGAYLTTTWSVIRGLYAKFDPDVIHCEVLGALDAIEGRNQAFNAILTQDFAAVLSQVKCPVAVVQASDDPLAWMLTRVRASYPAIDIEIMGPAQTAAPELQPAQYTSSLLRFIAAHDTKSPSGVCMTDRNFHLVKTATGFDLTPASGARPKPGPGEVLVKVHAVSLNRRDLSIRDFSYPVFGADRFTPLSDGAGEIVSVGPDVTKFKVGDRVSSTFFQNWPDGRLTMPAVMSALGSGGRGMMADYVVLAETGVAPVPQGWSYEEGASISCAALTAWSALQVGGVQRGDWVLVLGTGGVAIFALQIAVAMGAKVVLLSSSDDKLARAREMGAAVTINYRTTPEWDVAVKEATGGGVQQAVELGGQGTLARSVASTGIGGHIALVGALAGFGGDLSGVALVSSGLRVSAISVGSYAEHMAMTKFLVAHNIKPVIDSVFSLDKVEDAYKRMEAGAFGKIVVKM